LYLFICCAETEGEEKKIAQRGNQTGKNGEWGEEVK
jgi:hypothetical protein